jgi:hypothetical protein
MLFFFVSSVGVGGFFLSVIFVFFSSFFLFFCLFRLVETQSFVGDGRVRSAWRETYAFF